MSAKMPLVKRIFNLYIRYVLYEVTSQRRQGPPQSAMATLYIVIAMLTMRPLRLVMTPMNLQPFHRIVQPLRAMYSKRANVCRRNDVSSLS